MSRHVLVVSLDRAAQARLDAGELVLPEHIDHHEYAIVCPPGNGCSGWEQCGEPHEGGDEDKWRRPEGDDEREFHGVNHTWRYGHGWTVPFTTGCIVTYNGDYELPNDYDELPIGEYDVDDDWDDTSCNLILCEEKHAA